MRPDHNTESSMPYSLQIVCGFFYVPLGCEHWKVVRRGLRFIVLIQEDLKVLTICGCNYKGSTFSSVILRPWVLVQPESNSRPPAWQPDAQPTEPPVRGGKVKFIRCLKPYKLNQWLVYSVKNMFILKTKLIITIWQGVNRNFGKTDVNKYCEGSQFVVGNYPQCCILSCIIHNWPVLE